MADDFFNLAQLEAPKMMPETPMGGGALAGLMYGQDKARQNDAFTKANSLAEVRAMLENQKASETMAGAPGRAASISYDNQMAQGRLGTLQDALSTQSNTASNTNRASEIAKLSEYAMDYDPKWDSDKKKSFLDDMKARGVDKVGNRTVDEMKDNLDHTDSIMSHVKNTVVNTPQQAQKIQQETVAGDNWVRRMQTMGQFNQTREETRQAGANSRNELSNETKENIAELSKQAKMGNRKPIDAIADKIANGTATELERKTLTWLIQNNPQVLAAGVKADTGGLNLELSGGQPTGKLTQPQAPVVSAPPGQAADAPPPTPQPQPGVPSPLPGTPAPQPAPSAPPVKLDPTRGKISMAGQEFTVHEGYGKMKGFYQIMEGPLKGKIVDASGKIVQ